MRPVEDTTAKPGKPRVIGVEVKNLVPSKDGWRATYSRYIELNK